MKIITKISVVIDFSDCIRVQTLGATGKAQICFSFVQLLLQCTVMCF